MNTSPKVCEKKEEGRSILLESINPRDNIVQAGSLTFPELTLASRMINAARLEKRHEDEITTHTREMYKLMERHLTMARQISSSLLKELKLANTSLVMI